MTEIPFRFNGKNGVIKIDEDRGVILIDSNDLSLSCNEQEDEFVLKIKVYSRKVKSYENESLFGAF